MTTAVTPAIMARLAPEMLDLFVEKQYWPRSVELIELVAGGSFLGHPTPIGASMLVELGRTPFEARNDRAALQRLGRDQVLVRYRGPGGGHYPDAWLVSPDVRHWRGVPWRPGGQRAAAAWIAQRAGEVGGVAGAQGVKSPGNRGAQGVNPPPNWPETPEVSRSDGNPLRASGNPLRASDPATTSTFATPSNPLRASDDAPHTVPLKLLNTPSLTPPQIETPRERESGKLRNQPQPRPEGFDRVVADFARVVAPIWGEPLDRLARLVELRGELAVRSETPRLAGFKTAVRALEELERALTPVSTAAPPPMWKCSTCHDTGYVIDADDVLHRDRPCDHAGV